MNFPKAMSEKALSYSFPFSYSSMSKKEFQPFPDKKIRNFINFFRLFLEFLPVLCARLYPADEAVVPEGEVVRLDEVVVTSPSGRKTI